MSTARSVQTGSESSSEMEGRETPRDPRLAPGGRAASGGAGVEVRPSRPEEDALRDAFVEGHPRASFFHLAGWRRAVERVFFHDPCDLLAWRDGALVGVLPLMRCAGLFGGRKLISNPFAVYGGPVGADDAVESALLDAASAQARSENVGRLELRCRFAPQPRPELVPFDLYSTFIQELPDDPERVLAGMPKKSRAEARKARERHHLELIEGVWYLDDLARLFHVNKRQLGSPGLPRAWFQELREQFRERVVVHMVHREGEPLMAVLSFVHGDTLLAYYAGTAEGADRTYSVSNFCYMALREWAVERGLRRFDFGRSRNDSGAFSFKQRQGFEAAPLPYRIELVKDRGLPTFTPSNPRTKILRDTWSRLPAGLTTRLSNRLARYLP